MGLEKMLAQLREASGKRVPQEKRAIMGGAVQDLRTSGIMDGVIKVGDPLPAFALANAAGVEIASPDLLARGAVVLTVFRGHW